MADRCGGCRHPVRRRHAVRALRIALPRAIAPAALADRDPHAEVIDLGGDTMGTRWSVRLAVPTAFDATWIKQAIEARLDTIVAQMSQWHATSLLSRFNRAAAGSWTVLPPDFATVIATGLAIAAATKGAFDPTIGRLSELWGFGATAVAAPPDDVAITSARATAGWRRLAWAPTARCLRQPGGLWLDLAGVAKGHAVDAVADLLGGLGIRHCLVEIGGELVGRGVRPDGQPWWVDVEPLPGAGALPPLRIALHGLAIATSGNYRRGEHTLDPRTGRATANGVASVSVIHRSAMHADAWATALTVLGPIVGFAIAERAGIAARWVVGGPEETTELLSPALQAMLVD